MSEIDSSALAAILEQFDASREDATFIDLDHGYYYTIDSRLHAFSDGARWALIGEVVGYNPRAGNVIDVIHVYGNCLTIGEPGFENDDFHSRINNMDEIDNDEEEFISGPLDIRGTRVEIAAETGDDLDEVFRKLVPEHRELLLGSEEELRRRIPADLPEILTLDEWNQPDLFTTPPSESETYQLLAKALATAEPSHWQPTLAPNTHWSNWMLSGTL